MTDTKSRDIPETSPKDHESRAAQLRTLAQQATTPGIRARLLREAEEEEWIARQNKRARVLHVPFKAKSRLTAAGR